MGHGEAGPGMAWCCAVWQGNARPGGVMRGVAGIGKVWYGPLIMRPILFNDFM